MLVITTLFGWQEAVSLHSHQDQIGGIASERTDGSGGKGTDHSLENSRVCAVIPFLFDILSHVEIDAETEVTVEQLSQDG